MFDYLIVLILIMFAAAVIFSRIRYILKGEKCTMCSQHCNACDSKYCAAIIPENKA